MLHPDGVPGILRPAVDILGVLYEAPPFLFWMRKSFQKPTKLGRTRRSRFSSGTVQVLNATYRRGCQVYIPTFDVQPRKLLT